MAHDASHGAAAGWAAPAVDASAGPGPMSPPPQPSLRRKAAAFVDDDGEQVAGDRRRGSWQAPTPAAAASGARLLSSGRAGFEPSETQLFQWLHWKHVQGQYHLLDPISGASGGSSGGSDSGGAAASVPQLRQYSQQVACSLGCAPEALPELIPEDDLLSKSRPWLIQGLSVAVVNRKGALGLVGFFCMAPQWRTSKRRRRECALGPCDRKAPCWKVCQTTLYHQHQSQFGVTPERRMFRFKEPGAREGPAREKELWKMYEYAMKTDAQMLEDKLMGKPVWVVCKVVRETIDHMDLCEELSLREAVAGSISKEQVLASGERSGGPLLMLRHPAIGQSAWSSPSRTRPLLERGFVEPTASRLLTSPSTPCSSTTTGGEQGQDPSWSTASLPQLRQSSPGAPDADSHWDGHGAAATPSSTQGAHRAPAGASCMQQRGPTSIDPPFSLMYSGEAHCQASVYPEDLLHQKWSLAVSDSMASGGQRHPAEATGRGSGNNHASTSFLQLSPIDACGSLYELASAYLRNSPLSWHALGLMSDPVSTQSLQLAEDSSTSRPVEEGAARPNIDALIVDMTSSRLAYVYTSFGVLHALEGLHIQEVM
eukprot:SM000049S16785  [mRNA]  locus=s49:678561:682365:- [translate_table: standard]